MAKQHPSLAEWRRGVLPTPVSSSEFWIVPERAERCEEDGRSSFLVTVHEHPSMSQEFFSICME